MTQEGTAGLRERKKLETRAALRGAAVQLYRAHGPAAVTVPDICARAGVSPRTFFNYFATKDDAVFDWDHRLTCQLVEGFAARPADEPPLQALRSAITAAVPSLVDDPDWNARVGLLREHPELLPKLVHHNRRMEDALTRAVAERTGAGAETVLPRLLAGAGLVALRAALAGWTPDEDTGHLLARLGEAFDALAAGLPAGG